MHRTIVFLTAIVALTTGALAHTGVTNPAVLKRMEAMTEIADANKVMGLMVPGGTFVNPGTPLREALTVAGALGVIAFRSPVHAALSLL